jgi:hypothetical protein
MIIWLLATKDKHMLTGVEQAAQDYGAVPYYGSMHGTLPRAGVDEMIKIYAHGNEDEIGEAEGDPSWTPETLAKMLYDYLLPGGYKGELDIDACGSGVMDGDRKTFVDKLYRDMQARHHFTGVIWGYGGNVKGFTSKEVVEAAGGALPAGWMKVKAVDRG